MTGADTGRASDIEVPNGGSETPADDYDSPWKDVSRRFFPSLVEFFAQFLDWLLVLPEEMTKSFRARVEEIDQESKMKYVTSIERLSRKEGREEGRKEGRKEGFLEGLREALLTQFEEKFGPLDASVRRLVTKSDREQVILWMKRVLTASSLDEILAT